MKSILSKGIVLLSLLGVTIYLCRNAPEISVSDSTGVLMDGKWEDENYKTIDIEPSEIEKTQLPKDTSFVKKAVFPVGVKDEEEARSQLVHATIVLSGADSRSIHKPEVCLPGQGWKILTRQVQTLQVAGQELEVMELHLEKTKTLISGGKEVTRSFYTYWLVGNGKTTPHSWKRILLSNWDMFYSNLSHRWAYPSFMSYYVLKGTDEDQENEKKARQRVFDTITVFAPQFQKSLMK